MTTSANSDDLNQRRRQLNDELLNKQGELLACARAIDHLRKEIEELSIAGDCL